MCLEEGEEGMIMRENMCWEDSERKGTLIKENWEDYVKERKRENK